MLLLKTFAPWLLLAFLGQQVSLSSGARNKSRDKPAARGRGKFTGGGTMQCTWRAKDVGNTVRVSVNCKDPVARIKGGVTHLKCHYNAKSHSCPGYQSNPKGFWKQVTSAFRSLADKVCNDDHSPVIIAMCKRAPWDTHFKLDIHSVVATAQAEGDKSTQTPTPPPPPPRATVPAVQGCTERADHRKTAEENCGSWSSVCNFFFSMLQSQNC